MMTVHRAAAALLAGAALGSACAHEPAVAQAKVEPPGLRALIVRAESALQAGESDAARLAFEQAAALQHDADIEIGWVRAQMQAGEYRRALAFAAHIAGAHPHESQGAALYAWLLHLGGQDKAAHTTLARGLQRLPGDALLSGVEQRLAPYTADVAAASDTPWPFVPQWLGEPVPAQARSAGNAVLLPDARHALVPLSLIEGSRTLWLRNGLGRTTRAELLSSDAASGLAVLQLAAPLDAPAALTLAPREPFAGSPGWVVGYRADAQARAAWPKLSPGFLGMPAPGAMQRRLGIEVPVGSAGSPVFDVSGRLAGIVLPAGADGQPRLGSAAALSAVAMLEPAGAAAPPPMPLDQLYERALRSSLQLIRGD